MTEAQEQATRRELSSLAPETVTRLLQAGKLVHIPLNWTPIRRGQPGDEVYFILEGAFRVFRGDQVAVLKAGDFAGEMSPVHEALRSARITVASPVLALAWPGIVFNELRGELPDFGTMVQEIAGSRRASNAG